MKRLFQDKTVQNCIFALLLFLFPFYSTITCLAEVVTDGSLGPSVNLDGPNYAITDDLGQIQGANLFHSFDQFNLQSNESAVFSGPSSIGNIIARVTGGDPSLINGTLRSDISGADLFLLNPDGIMFGPNAVLDITGSFFAGTADFIRFGDGAVFHADLGRESILSVARPEAFGFLSANPAAISITDSHLAVPAGERFSVIGGDINIVGQESGVVLNAPGGNVQVVGVGAAGEINLDSPGLLNLPGGANGKISIKNSTFSTGGQNPKSIVIKGGGIRIDGSAITSDNHDADDMSGPGIDLEATSQIELTGGSMLDCFSTGSGRGGDLCIKTGDLRLTDASKIRVAAFDQGTGGDIDIETGALTLESGSSIESMCFGSGPGGSIQISAADSVIIDGENSSQFETNIVASTAGPAKAGNVLISMDFLELRNGGAIGNISNEEGAPGEIRLTVGSIRMNNGFILSSNNFAGDSGPIIIRAEIFEASDFSQVSTSTMSSGNAGAIDIEADTIILDGDLGTGIFSFNDQSGNSGDISIIAGELVLQNSAMIGSSTYGTGTGGNIFIKADNLTITGLSQDQPSMISSNSHDAGDAGKISIQIEGKLILSNNGRISAEAYGSGNAGDIDLSASEIVITGGSYISSCTESSGAAGSIEVDSKGEIRIDDGIIATGTLGDGIGGDIFIKADSLSLLNDAAISAKSLSAADAGNIDIKTNGSMKLIGSRIATESAQADGGDIEISAGKTILLSNGTITAAVGGGPQTTGGNIALQAGSVALDRSHIVANALDGQGGNIDIHANVYLAGPASAVDASSELGIDGITDIRAPLRNLSGDLKPLTTEFSSAVTLFKEPCEARAKGGGYGSFIVKGRQALPIDPGMLQASPLMGF